MSILIVDDAEDMRVSLRRVLEAEGFPEVTTAGSAREAFELLGMDQPAPALAGVDVILMDLSMPELDGVEACQRIKRHPRLADIPVLMVTGRTEDKALEAAFAAGAADYIRKPIHPVELLARLRSAVTLKHELDCRRLRERELLAATRQLQEANQMLQRLTNLDALTGVANRRYFSTVLTREWARGSRDKASLAAVMVDVDYFKAYNDTYGHPCGDECLCQVARALQDAVKRPGDLLARYGGEEFVILLPRTGLSGAITLAEEARCRVENLKIAHLRSPIQPHVTISLGAASTLPDRHGFPENLVTVADQALYQAKREGRNRVGVFKDAFGPSWTRALAANR